MGRFCIFCGSELPEDAVFCDNCGQRVQEEQPIQSEPQQPEPVQQVQPVQQPAPQSQSRSAPAQHHSSPSGPSRSNNSHPVQHTSSQPRYQTVETQRVVQPQQVQQQAPAAQQPANVTVKNKKSAAPAVIIAIIATLIVVAGAAVAAYFLFLKPADNKNNTQQTTAATEKSTEEASETEDTTEAETEEETTEANPADAEVEDPEPEDFTWSIGTSSAPAGSEVLESSEDISGKWKANIQYVGSSGVQELDIFNIMAGDRAVTIEVEPKQINYDGSYQDSSDSSYKFEGAIDTGTIQATGTAGKLTLTQFYKLGSSQYGLGELINPSGEKAYVYLVRP